MMKNKIAYEVIEQAITGDTVALLAVQERYKPYIAYQSHGDSDLQDLLNAKLLEAVLKFKLDYQLPHK